MSDYQFEVFISYSRDGGAAKWLTNNFLPKLKDCLIDEVRPRPRIFLDREMRTGVHWPSELQNALRHSKIMIAILSAAYFDSPWCMAELQSIREREKLLGISGPDKPQGLVYPIRHSDSHDCPDRDNLSRSWRDFEEYGTGEPVFQSSQEWMPFHKEVKKVAVELGALLKRVPPWRPDWPLVETPEPLLRPHPPLPRL